MVAPLRLRKIKENSPTLWYNVHSRPKESSAENGAQLEENKTSLGYVCNPSSQRERDAASKLFGNAFSVTTL